MSWRDGPQWYAPSRPLAADGIKARSRTGDIGSTWWSKRFLEVLQSMGLSNRLQRGKRYARAGQVLELTVAAGKVSARVQGSRPQPYSVEISAPPIGAGGWERIEAALASRAVFLAKLLAGEMPANVEEAFAESGCSLFPASLGDLHSRCTCPDSANPCKHIAAVFYLLAESFDEDPFRMFAWRGRTRDDLLENLRGRQGGAAGAATVGGGPGQGGWALPYVAGSDLATDPAGFFGDPGFQVPAVPGPAADGEEPGSILVGLDPLDLEVDGEPFAEALGRVFPVVARWAAERLYDE